MLQESELTEDRTDAIQWAKLVRAKLPESKTTRSKQIAHCHLGIINETEQLKIEIRWDDSCGNGANSFAVTGEVTENAPLRHPFEAQRSMLLLITSTTT